MVPVLNRSLGFTRSTPEEIPRVGEQGQSTKLLSHVMRDHDMHRHTSFGPIEKYSVLSTQPLTFKRDCISNCKTTPTHQEHQSVYFGSAFVGGCAARFLFGNAQNLLHLVIREVVGGLVHDLNLRQALCGFSLSHPEETQNEKN